MSVHVSCLIWDIGLFCPRSWMGLGLSRDIEQKMRCCEISPFLTNEKQKSFNQKESSKLRSMWVAYLLSLYFRSWLPDCCPLRQVFSRQRLQRHVPQLGKGTRPCATVGYGWHPEERVHSWAPWNLRKTWINTSANSSKADFILKLHASGATNKLLGIFILKCLSNIN